MGGIFSILASLQFSISESDTLLKVVHLVIQFISEVLLFIKKERQRQGFITFKFQNHYNKTIFFYLGLRNSLEKNIYWIHV